jgi:hypothetical protein
MKIKIVKKQTCGCEAYPFCEHAPNATQRKPPYAIDSDECVRLCEAIAAFWGDDVVEAPIWPGAYLTEQDVPIRDLIRAAVGWRKP